MTNDFKKLVLGNAGKKKTGSWATPWNKGLKPSKKGKTPLHLQKVYKEHGWNVLGKSNCPKCRSNKWRATRKGRWGMDIEYKCLKCGHVKHQSASPVQKYLDRRK